MSETVVKNMESAAGLQIISSSMMYNSTMKFDSLISSMVLSAKGFIGVINTLQIGFRNLVSIIAQTSYNYKTQGVGAIHNEKYSKVSSLHDSLNKNMLALSKKSINDIGLQANKHIKSMKTMSGSAPGSTGSTGSASSGQGMMGPMMKLYFIIKPLMELIKGLMEPLEPLMDIIGAIGSILGLLLVPIIEPIVGLLIPMIPILIAGINVVTPMLKLLFLPITYLGAVLTLTTPYLEKILGVIGWLTSWVGALVDWIKKAMYSIANGFNKLTNVFGWFKWNKAVIDW